MTNSASQARIVSALIKAIRLRRVDLATPCLAHLWAMGGDVQARTRRRILICSAEDNTSVAVMDRVSHWHGSGELDVRHAIREVLRISTTPNWYATPSGRDYIRAWWRAELRPNRFIGGLETSLYATIECAVRANEMTQAMQAFLAIVSKRDYSRKALGSSLRSIAVEQRNELAIRLADIFIKHVEALWWDSNFTGQCLCTLLTGPIGPQLESEPDEGLVDSLAQLARAQVSPPDVPPWCLDGIHVPGADPRFSGTVKSMAAACIAYESFGRLSPDDEWNADELLAARDNHGA
jgi:hypothetical protein